MPRPRFFLIDSFGFIFRAYHARARSAAPPMRTSTGLSTEAVYIFNNMLRKLVKEHAPAYIAAIFESGEPTHRVQEFAEYKANRTEMPPDLADQIPHVRRVLEAMRIPILHFPGFEADDVIGTLARRVEGQGLDVVIVSSDKDMLQLVDDHVFMLNPAKDDAWYDAAKVKEFMGVHPGQVADLLALMGDAVDNIPGAPGIGDKGARDLIERFGSVEAAIERAAEVERKTYRESLAEQRRADPHEQAARVHRHRCAGRVCAGSRQGAGSGRGAPKSHLQRDGISQPAEGAGAVGGFARRAIIGRSLGREEIPAGVPVAVAISKAAEGEFALDTIGLAWGAGEARSVSGEMLAEIKPWLEDAASPKIACDVKSALLELGRLGVDAHGFDHDVMLYAFLLDADPSGCPLEEQARRRLDLKLGHSPEQHADITLEIWNQLAPAVDSRGLRDLYSNIELPLARVLARMEREGIRIDSTELLRLSQLMEGQIARFND